MSDFYTVVQNHHGDGYAIRAGDGDIIEPWDHATERQANTIVALMNAARESIVLEHTLPEMKKED